MTQSYQELECLFKGLALEKRLRILNMLSKRGWMTVNEVSGQLKIPVQTASRNLDILARARVIASRQKGAERLYGIRYAGMELPTLLAAFAVTLSEKPDDDLVSLTCALRKILFGPIKTLREAISND